jgi:hypothetical protein
MGVQGSSEREIERGKEIDIHTDRKKDRDKHLNTILLIITGPCCIQEWRAGVQRGDQGSRICWIQPPIPNRLLEEPWPDGGLSS